MKEPVAKSHPMETGMISITPLHGTGPRGATMAGGPRKNDDMKILNLSDISKIGKTNDSKSQLSGNTFRSRQTSVPNLLKQKDRRLLEERVKKF